jgi:hypothetical protein
MHAVTHIGVKGDELPIDPVIDGGLNCNLVVLLLGLTQGRLILALDWRLHGCRKMERGCAGPPPVARE